jgi:putative membrane protein
MLLNKQISIPYFLKQIRYEILAISVFAILVGWLDHFRLLKELTFPIAIPSIVGTAVSLLLAFRIAQSYERWWEARIVWGAIVNDSRTLIREVQLFIKDNNEKEIAVFAERQIIWNYALGESLRQLPFSDRVQSYISSNNITAENIPNALLDQHTAQIKRWCNEGRISEFRQVQLDTTIARLCDSMGKCERIKKTVFPRSYSMLLHTLIFAFTFILPFGLSDNLIVPEILLSIALPVMFIAIEKTAIIMQDPFENTPVDTPMTALATTIEINIRQMIGDPNLPVREESNTYYQM